MSNWQGSKEAKSKEARKQRGKTIINNDNLKKQEETRNYEEQIHH